MSTKLLQAARSSIRASLSASTATLLAVGLAAGLAPDAAHAWGSDYESMGRTLGSELGNVAGGNSVFSPTARIASTLGGFIGQQIGKPIDQASEEQRRVDDIQRQAREQAVRDAAYDAERKRIDPNYTPQARYADMASRAEQSVQNSRSISSNIADWSRNTDRLVQEYQQRNARNAR